MFCVYITTYKGNLLPNKYVGSSSVERIQTGYRGSVNSKEYKDLWEKEIKENIHLFETTIVSLHQTRQQALAAELIFQQEHNVVESKEWINKSLAIPSGFFGMNVEGKNNPMFGKNRKGEKHKGGANISRALKEHFQTDNGSKRKQNMSQRYKECNPSRNPLILAKMKESWKKTYRNVGPNNPMYGKSALKGKKLYNNGIETKAFFLNEQPEGWFLGRHKN